jgi:hypothetical protein
MRSADAARADAPAIILAHDRSWIVRASDGVERVSIVKLAAPAMTCVAAFKPPGGREGGVSFLAVARGRLALVSPDVSQADYASTRRERVPGGHDDAPVRVRLVARDAVTGNALVAAVRTTGGVSMTGIDDRVARWEVTSYRSRDRFEDDDDDEAAAAEGEDTTTTTTTTTTTGADVASDPSRRSEEEGEEGTRARDDALMDDAAPLRHVLTTADASAKALCHVPPPPGVLGGVVAVALRGPARRPRRVRVGISLHHRRVEGRLLLMRIVETPWRRAFEVAATVALPRPATCVAPAGPGLVFVGCGPRVYCVRACQRDAFDAAEEAESVRGTLAGTLVASNYAHLSARRRVRAVASGGDSCGGGGGGGERAIPIAFADARAGAPAFPLKTSDEHAGPGGLEYPSFAFVGAEATTRRVVDLRARRRGETCGIDSSGRIFVLRRREDEDAWGAEEGACSPEQNLTLAASFTLRAKPSAMLVMGDDEDGGGGGGGGGESGERETKRGPSVLIGTRQGGVSMLSELAIADWAVLREATRRCRAHPHVAPVLGASHARATGAWPPRGRRGAGPRPKANAPARTPPPPPPLVIDGALLRELLDLPADAQREVLTDAIDVEASDGDGEEEDIRGEGSRTRAPALPVEAVLGVIQRVLEP